MPFPPTEQVRALVLVTATRGSQTTESGSRRPKPGRTCILVLSWSTASCSRKRPHTLLHSPGRLTSLPMLSCTGTGLAHFFRFVTLPLDSCPSNMLSPPPLVHHDVPLLQAELLWSVCFTLPHKLHHGRNPVSPGLRQPWHLAPGSPRRRHSATTARPIPSMSWSSLQACLPTPRYEKGGRSWIGKPPRDCRP